MFKQYLFFVDSLRRENVLPDKCDTLLQLFANDTAKFTFCVLNHTRSKPMTMCENCVNEYNQVLEKYDTIQKVRIILFNIYYNFDYLCNCTPVLTGLQNSNIFIAVKK